jgi:hypothetical protein
VGLCAHAYKVPDVAETVQFDHIKGHYYGSHRSINPTGVVKAVVSIFPGRPERGASTLAGRASALGRILMTDDDFGAYPFLADVRFAARSEVSVLIAAEKQRHGSAAWTVLKNLLTRRKIGPRYFRHMCLRARDGGPVQVPLVGDF